MKIAQRILAAFAALIVYLQPIQAQRVNLTAPGGGFLTISAGTPIRLTTTPTMVSSLFVQARHGNAGVVYVLINVPLGTACNAGNAAQLSAELGAGTATQPGSSLTDPQGWAGQTPAEAEDLSKICIDGTANGDQVLVSYWKSN